MSHNKDCGIDEVINENHNSLKFYTKNDRPTHHRPYSCCLFLLLVVFLSSVCKNIVCERMLPLTYNETENKRFISFGKFTLIVDENGLPVLWRPKLRSC